MRKLVCTCFVCFADGDGLISYGEFRRFVVMLPGGRDGEEGGGRLLAAAAERAAPLPPPAVPEPAPPAAAVAADAAAFPAACLPRPTAVAPLLHGAGAQLTRSNIMWAWLDSSDWLDGMEYRLGHMPPSQPLVGEGPSPPTERPGFDPP